MMTPSEYQWHYGKCGAVWGEDPMVDFCWCEQGKFVSYVPEFNMVSINHEHEYLSKLTLHTLEEVLNPQWAAIIVYEALRAELVDIVHQAAKRALELGTRVELPKCVENPIQKESESRDLLIPRRLALSIRDWRNQDCTITNFMAQIEERHSKTKKTRRK